MPSLSDSHTDRPWTVCPSTGVCFTINIKTHNGASSNNSPNPLIPHTDNYTHKRAGPNTDLHTSQNPLRRTVVATLLYTIFTIYYIYYIISTLHVHGRSVHRSGITDRRWSKCILHCNLHCNAFLPHSGIRCQKCTIDNRLKHVELV